LISSHQICLQIRNRCATIPAEILASLTKPFITTKPDGNGLGLAIVKKIVEAHGGKLEIDSSAIAVMIVKVLLPI
jgi:signal transduction histidine kinase